MTPALPPTSCPEGSAPDATLQALPGALRQQPAYPGVTLTGVSFHATEHLPPDVPQATIVVRAAVHFTLGGQAHATPATIEALTTLLTARSAAEIQPLTERPTPCTGRLLRTLHEATLGDVIRHVAEQCLTDHLRRTQSRSRALGTLAALMLTGMLLALTTKLLGGTSFNALVLLLTAVVPLSILIAVTLHTTERSARVDAHFALMPEAPHLTPDPHCAGRFLIGAPALLSEAAPPAVRPVTAASADPRETVRAEGQQRSLTALRAAESQVLALQAAHPDDAALAERAGALLTQIRAATEQHQGEARAAAVDAQLAQLEADVQTELNYLRDR